MSGCTGTEAEKQIGLWERRMRGLRRMLLGWDQTKPPDPPYLIGIDVIGVNSVAVRIQESCDGPIATKFKGTGCSIKFNKSTDIKAKRLQFSLK